MRFFPAGITWQDLPVLGRMIGLWMVVELLRRRMALPALVRWFDAAPHRSPVASVMVQRWVTLSQRLLRRIYGQEFCMVQSLILFRLLRSHGVPVTLHVGITKRDGRLRGHAWLEGETMTLTDVKDPRRVFTITFSYPSTQYSITP